MLLIELKDFSLKTEKEGTASFLFRDRLTSIFDKHENLVCPPDFAELLLDLENLYAEIKSAQEKALPLNKKKSALKEKLNVALQQNKLRKVNMLLSEIDKINLTLLPMENSSLLITPEWLIEYRRIYEKPLNLSCPAGMIYIEGTYCIDKYEYPNRQSATPRVYTSYKDAEKSCAATGKFLCTGQEWMRACNGNACRHNFRALIPFNAQECNSGLDSQPSARLRESGFDRNCDTQEGVSDMFGNAWEWVDNDYKGSYKVIAGGAHYKDSAAMCSSFTWAGQNDTTPYVGFRCCSSPSIQEIEQSPKPGSLTAKPLPSTGSNQ